MTRRRLGLLALVFGAAVIWALPATGSGASNPLSPRGAVDALKVATGQVGGAVQQTAQQTDQGSKTTVQKLDPRNRKKAAQQRTPSADPQTDPPIHEENPHGQATSLVADITPSAERPQPDSTDGKDSGEEVIGGRARGEQQADGSFRGHITLLSLFGHELSGVNSTPGQANHGPLEPLQSGLLDPICKGSGDNLCLSLLVADSTTDGNGSTNDFAVARVRLGGANGLNVGAGEAQGTIEMDGQCQVAGSVTRSATVVAAGQVLASLPDQNSTSRQCPGQAEETTASSRLGTLFGQKFPLPDPGCGNGVPNTKFTPLHPIATIVCNAAATPGSITRNGFDLYALDMTKTSLLQASAADGEAKAVAAAVNSGGGGGNQPNEGSGERSGTPQCADGVDNDGDGRIDARDGGCHSDGNPNNPDSYDATDNSEAGGNNGSAQCSDGVDNDGDGKIDAADPGCHSDGNANNAKSYNPNDDSEADNAGNLSKGSLAFTGTDVIGLALAGLLVLAGGLVLRRRREDLLS